MSHLTLIAFFAGFLCGALALSGVAALALTHRVAPMSDERLGNG